MESVTRNNRDKPLAVIFATDSNDVPCHVESLSFSVSINGSNTRFHTRIASSAASALLVVLFVVLKTLSVEAAVVVVAVAGVVVVMDGLDGVIHAVLMRVSDVIPCGQPVVRPNQFRLERVLERFKRVLLPRNKYANYCPSLE